MNRTRVLTEEAIALELATHHDHAMLKRAEILKIFDEFDLDGSGTIDEDEVKLEFPRVIHSQ